MQDYRIPPHAPQTKKPKKRSRLRFLLIMATTTILIATGGFGTFPDNPITNTLREEIGQNIPPEYLGPFNSFIANFSAPPIEPMLPAQADQPPLDVISPILDFFQQNVEQPLPAGMTEVPASEQVAQPTAESTPPPATNASTEPTAEESATEPPVPDSGTATEAAVLVTETTETVEPLRYPYPLPLKDDDEDDADLPTPKPTPPLIILYSAGVFNGDLGGRTGADDYCSLNLPAGYANYHAFIAVSAADDFIHMPNNYSIPKNEAIRSMSGVIIAVDWADLISGDKLPDLQISCVLETKFFWWSGANVLGENDNSLSTQDCQNWSSNSSSDFGFYGTTEFLSGSYNPCSTLNELVCIGY